ncbi:MAG: 16S rRNA (guanine(527)-N(7))-methyltransferase RsmG [Proteobacteria bacterium]|nr:16S rRNA (guanine(527)-N(7))-methyltransferase RsmG [Pseudomonadota bacterium]
MPLPDRAAVLAAAATLGLALSDDQADRLLAYLALLQRWNATYNLTAIRDPDAMWLQHGLDCMAAVPAVGTLSNDGRRLRILDVGSGGGLPGVVWALLLPQADVVCVDAVGKKAAFIRQAAGALRLPNLQARHARVEDLSEAPFDLVASRAFASLADFTRLTRRLLSPGGRWLAMKGKPPADELAALDPQELMFHVEPLAVPGLAAERCLVWLQPATVDSPKP